MCISTVVPLTVLDEMKNHIDPDSDLGLNYLLIYLPLYSRTSVPRALMARLPRLFRTRS